MKRLSLFLLLLPQLAFAQFISKSFNLDSSDKVTKTRCELTFSKDTTIMLENRSRIYGLSINGTSNLENDNNSFIRVTLEDDYNYEYLVYELFPMLSDESRTVFENTAMETVMLDGIVPKKVNIHLLNASLTISQINTQTEPDLRKSEGRDISALQKAQGKYIADLLNTNLERRHALWRADVTSMSEMSYEEKKGMFGGNVPELYGWEYYRAGIFCFPMSEGMSQSVHRDVPSSPYISEWDWRNRHKKNWLTKAKSQGNCGSCWAFSTIGVIEAYKNLYYNQIINDDDNDLSEQELVSCVSGSDCGGGFTNKALEYIESYGIVNDSCFRYTATNGDCDSICPCPCERVFLQSHKIIKENVVDSTSVSEDSVKKSLFRCPLTISYKSHAMVLAGYKIIEVNDILHEWYLGWPILVNDTINQHLIGQTAWLIKNSGGSSWGDHGFGYILGDSNKFYRIFMPTGRITSMQYDDSDIVCEDADGDGYYFWGVGDKPAHCPAWAPSTPDGDDSDINSGPLDNYGYCANLPAGITIKAPETYSSNSSTSYRLGIVNGGTLTITGTTTLTENAAIRVCEGGTLIIDGGTLQNADITLVPGCTVIVRNNGKINMASGKDFVAPEGAVVNIESGEIN